MSLTEALKIYFDVPRGSKRKMYFNLSIRFNRIDDYNKKLTEKRSTFYSSNIFMT